MRYEGMTVAQLREIAMERELALPKNAKKADLIAALKENDEGVQSVDAEVIEGQNGLAVSLLPGKLHANFATLDARIDSILADYEGWEPTGDNPDELKEVTRNRKYLNGLAKELDEKRKDIKREYLRPLTELEEMFNTRRDRIKAVSERLQAVEKEADEARRTVRENELREFWEDMAGLLADVVPYSKIADPKWLNKSVNIQAAKKEVEAKCFKVASDYETLKGLNLEFADEAELRFFETLDLGDATSYASKLAEDKKRLETMKAERESYMQPAVEPAPVMPVPGLTLESAPVMQPVAVSESAPIVQPEPAPYVPVAAPYPAEFVKDDAREAIMQRIKTALERYEVWQLRNLAEALETAGRVGDEQPRVMVIDKATTTQAIAIGKICGMFGVTGTMKAGTLKQAYEREVM